jgi:uncharacterized protein YecT (DUF1311 family)/N-acetylneuraminic acid mutarotase
MKRKNLFSLYPFYCIIISIFLLSPYIRECWGGETVSKNKQSTIVSDNQASVAEDKAANQPGIYGTKGVAASTNTPGGRYGSSNWIDSKGNLWLFGGNGIDNTGAEGCLNDLWKFDGAKWTWVSGDFKKARYGIYGTKGVTASINKPGARSGSISWIDSKDNLWLFGGSGYAETGNEGELNDLWKFDGTNWTWIAGDSAYGIKQPGVYGIKGVASDMNTPCRLLNGIYWIDSNDNLWLFGGFGSNITNDLGDLNDLWKFDGTNWVWISGDSAINNYGVYGTKGVASATNNPGARLFSKTWIDSKNNLWLFGGYGYAATGGLGGLNDLWKFDGTNWTWVAGDSTSHGKTQHGVYGTNRVASDKNTPGILNGSINWIDSKDNLWLFGGQENDSKGVKTYFNDLWKFDGTNWSWVTGDNKRNQPGIYGNKRVAASTNTPGARSGCTSWKDRIGNHWLFGGYGFDSSGSQGYLNDVWKFDGANWTWVAGDSTIHGEKQPAIYGTKGVASDMNTPGTRRGTINWIDSKGNLWLFGGLSGFGNKEAMGYLNDLWKFDGTNWTWVAGGSLENQPDTFYGTQGSAGFDCKKATTPIEKCICSDQDLSYADSWLNKTYLSCLKFLSQEDKKKFKAEQITWMKKRDKICSESQDARSNIYGIDKDCLKKMYDQRTKELNPEIPGLLSFDDVNSAQNLKQLILESNKFDGIPGSYFRLSDNEYLFPIDWGQGGRVQLGMYYANTKTKKIDKVLGGYPLIEGVIKGNGITWIIVYYTDLHWGISSNGYNAIMIKDKTDNYEPYKVFHLASISSNYIEEDFGEEGPCPHLTDSQKENDNSYSELKDYDVKDLNGDGINDIIFQIEKFDCVNNKHKSIKEMYYFLSKDPFIKKETIISDN